MTDFAHTFLRNLAMVLSVAAVTTVVFQRLRQPVVLGYLLAGLIIGPHLPVPLVADPEIIQALAELGVILLMFALGLEFSLRKLLRVGASAAIIAVVQVAIMIWLGYLTARLLGWTAREGLFTGSLIAISSTTIIAKAFKEQRVAGRHREIVLAVLIVEDLIAILLMATLTTVGTGSGLSGAALAHTVGRLGLFLAVLLIVGMVTIPRAIRYVLALDRPETTLVASVGICFAVALLAQSFGYSVALGAFLAGSLIAESGQEKPIEHLVQPVRDMFAAIFFVAVGMLIDPALVARHWVAVVALTIVVVLGKVVGVSLGAFLTGAGTRSSIQAGMSLAQIGEFSFIIAGLGLTLGATRDFLYPVAVAVSGLTTLLTPWLIRASGPVANFVDRKLPPALQTFASLYGTWVEQLQSAPSGQSRGARIRRLLLRQILDASLLAAIVIATAHWLPGLEARVSKWLPGFARLARAGVIGVALFASLPFVIGVVRAARRMGLLLAEEALPGAAKGQVDLANAPRRAFLVTLQIGSLILVGAPLLAVTQPFLPSLGGAVVFLALLFFLALAFWRQAANLQGHVRAGAQVILEALATQAAGTGETATAPSLARVRSTLPGIGAPEPFVLEQGSPAIGQTLARINLRGITGASVIAIGRAEGSVGVPTGSEVLHVGDVLALAGTQEAIAAARSLLSSPAADRPPPGALTLTVD